MMDILTGVRWYLIVDTQFLDPQDNNPKRQALWERGKV